MLVVFTSVLLLIGNAASKISLKDIVDEFEVFYSLGLKWVKNFIVTLEGLFASCLSDFPRLGPQSKLKLSDLDQNWAKTRPLLFKTFESSNAMDSHRVHWSRGVDILIRNIGCQLSRFTKVHWNKQATLRGESVSFLNISLLMAIHSTQCFVHSSDQIWL